MVARQRRFPLKALFVMLLIGVVGIGSTLILASVIEASPFVGIVALVVLLGMILVYVALMRDEYRQSRSEGASRVRALFRAFRRAVGLISSS
jgi:multidrug efflux pump subunit AcrB